MNNLTFHKSIYYIDSSENTVILKDYLTKYDYILNIEIDNTLELCSATINNTSNKSLENNIEVNTTIINDIFNKENVKLNNLNSECFVNGINKNKDTFHNRLLEILSIKLFGDANFKSILDNKNKDYLNKLFIDNIIMNINIHKKELFNYLFNESSKDNVNIDELNNSFNLLINKTHFIFPIIFSGQFLDLEDILKPLFEASNYGGSQIIDGKYNIPLILEIKRI